MGQFISCSHRRSQSRIFGVYSSCTFTTRQPSMIWTLPSSGVAGHGGEFRPLRHGHKVGLGGLLDGEVQPVPEVVVDVLVQGGPRCQGTL